LKSPEKQGLRMKFYVCFSTQNHLKKKNHGFYFGNNANFCGFENRKSLIIMKTSNLSLFNYTFCTRKRRENTPFLQKSHFSIEKPFSCVSPARKGDRKTQ